MTGEDFINNFAAAYVSARHTNNYMVGYNIIDISPNEKHAQHFEFVIHNPNFVDFSLKQFNENMVDIPEGTIKSSTLPGHNKRYLETKLILVKDNDHEIEDDDVREDGEGGSRHKFESNLNIPGQAGSNISGSHMRNSNLDKSSAGYDYKSTRFTTYEIDYRKGYNSGGSSFVHLTKGKYILRLKSERVPKPAKYAFTWTATEFLNIREAALSSDEKQGLLADSVLSTMHKVQHFNFEKGLKTEMIAVAGTFEEIGYGYVAIKASTVCPNTILLSVDPK